MAVTRIRLNPEKERARQLRERLQWSIAEIGLNVRTTNCLEEHNIYTVEDLLNTKPQVLLGIPNFGEKTLKEVYEALAKIGFER